MMVSHCTHSLGKEPSRQKVQQGENLLRTGSRPECWGSEGKGWCHWRLHLPGPRRPGRSWDFILSAIESH